MICTKEFSLTVSDACTFGSVNFTPTFTAGNYTTNPPGAPPSGSQFYIKLFTLDPDPNESKADIVRSFFYSGSGEIANLHLEITTLTGGYADMEVQIDSSVDGTIMFFSKAYLPDQTSKAGIYDVPFAIPATPATLTLKIFSTTGASYLHQDSYLEVQGTFCPP